MSEEKPEEKKEVVENPNTPAGEDKNQQKNIDYKAELEAERLKVEKAIEANKRVVKKIEETHNGTPEFDMEQLKATIVETVKSEVGVLSQRLDDDKVEDIIKNISSNDDESSLIDFHLKNSIKLSGNITDDIAKAKILANQKRTTEQLKEIKRSLEAKNNVENKAVEGQKQSTLKQGPEVTHTKEAIAYAKLQGLIWDADQQKFIGKREFKQSQAKK